VREEYTFSNFSNINVSTYFNNDWEVIETYCPSISSYTESNTVINDQGISVEVTSRWDDYDVADGDRYMQVTAKRTINQELESTAEREWLLGTQKDFYVFFRGEGAGKQLFNADDADVYVGEGISPIMKLNIVSASGGSSNSSW